MSKVYRLEKMQLLPCGLQEAWDFFSRPSNLAVITPPTLDFKVLHQTMGDKMYAGQVIEYTVRPLAGIAMYWMTEITQVQELKFFIDEQREGPYRIWHHQHHFRQVEKGVEMVDIVHYQLPFGWLGSLAHSLFVKSQLKKIFDFRYHKAIELFGPATPG